MLFSIFEMLMFHLGHDIQLIALPLSETIEKTLKVMFV